MSETTLWWLLAGAAVAVELVTGTFYLLMLGVGFAAGALAAVGGGGAAVQFIAAAVVGSGAVAGWHFMRRKADSRAIDPAMDPVQNLDLGEMVQVGAWAADHTALVRYRGTNWTAVPAGGVSQGPGPHRVREVTGTRLVLEKI